ncbi:MAG: type VI secretion system tube protein Hcp [Actinomycetota bacterium]|nr:type VI secretion system tube protein Hcp [Actinomycetota bacterium]MDQ6947480.1 type VI secretion system tube protein Hcp [Actinomycetota bacterium]
MAAVDYFLKIEGIDGESQDHKHKGEINVESFSWGESNSTSSSGGGGGAGKAVRQDFHFVAQAGKQSPKLMLACATGQHIKGATLTCRKAGGDIPVEFLKILLFDALVSSYQIGGTQIGGDATPRDQFSINFIKIEMIETSQSATGGPATVFGGFDFRLNQVIPPPSPPGG